MRAASVNRSESHKFDIAIAYRIYPNVAESARGLAGSEGKLRLAEICLRSFRKSLAGLRVKIWALLDGCPSGYADLFSAYFDSSELTIVALNRIGNRGTFLKQIEILLEQQDSEIVYFAEDDYFYLPGQFYCMIEFLLKFSDVHFVSPYDHLDCYSLDLHHRPKWLKIYGNRHWRTASSTCLTFMTTKTILEKTQSAFRAYKRRSLDCSVWLSLTKDRVFNPLFFSRHLFENHFLSRIVFKSWLYCWPQILFGDRWKLWVPVPGIATHLDASALSPNVDWRALIAQTERDLMQEVPALRNTVR